MTIEGIKTHHILKSGRKSNWTKHFSLHVTKQQQKNDNKKLKFFAKRFQYFNWNDDYTVDYTAKYWNHSDYQRDSCVSLEQ